MTNPDYTYYSIDYANRHVLIIEDNSPTGKFVEDNIDNIVDEIEEKEHIDPMFHFIICKSVHGFTGWKFGFGDFVKYEAAEWQTVAEYLLNEQM